MSHMPCCGQMSCAQSLCSACPDEKACLGEGVLHIVALGQGLVVGEDQGVHVSGHGGEHALDAVLRPAPRVHQLIRVDVQNPVYPVLRRQLYARCSSAPHPVTPPILAHAELPRCIMTSPSLHTTYMRNCCSPLQFSQNWTCCLISQEACCKMSDSGLAHQVHELKGTFHV